MRRLLSCLLPLTLCCAVFAIPGCPEDGAVVAVTDTGTETKAEVGAETLPPEESTPCGAAPKPRAPGILTTRQGRLVSVRTPEKATKNKNPAVDPAALLSMEAAGVGDTKEEAGEDGGVIDTLLPGSGSSKGLTGRRSLLYFSHLSDTQLVDDESPARLLAFDNEVAGGAGRPQEGAVAHATSAMHRTLAKIAKASRPFDFEIVTGDCADNAQKNELEWFVDLMDGKKGLAIDSGEKNDPVPGPNNDVKDPFDPVGAVAPWYFVFGNHDVEQQGNSVVDDFSKLVAVGTEPKGGTRDYRRKDAPVTREDVPADPNRRMLVRSEIIDLIKNRSSGGVGPAGHGFGGEVKASHYVTEPIKGMPVRLIQLDTSDPDGGSDGGVLRTTVRDFLEPALKKADEEKMLVILASHHSTLAINDGRGLEKNPDLITSGELELAVAKHPSVVLWLVGHDHSHRVRAVKGPSEDAPGYYEVMTGAIADYPSQSRIVELVFVPGAVPSLSIYLTTVDFEATTCLESRFRKWSLIDVNSGWSPSGLGRPADHNVELRRAMPKGVVFPERALAIETEAVLSPK